MSSVDPSADGVRGSERLVSGRVFDAVVSVFSLLMVTGIALDFRSHANGISFAEEGFLTPEHVFFYTAFLGVAGTLAAGTYARRRAGADWMDSVPEGYGWAVVGVVVFGLGGFGDLLWHSAFGFEESFEALVSPSHVTLAIGAVMFLSAPMRAAMGREADGASALSAVPVVVSLTLVLTIIGLFGGFVNPLMRPYPASQYYSMRMVVTMLVAFPLLYLGAVAVVCREFDAIPGAFTVAFGLSAVAITLPNANYPLILPAVVAGVVADLFAAFASPTRQNPRALRACFATVPLAFVATYFAVVDVYWSIDHSLVRPGMYRWSVHVVVGAVVLSSLAGVLLSLVVLDGSETTDADGRGRNDSTATGAVGSDGATPSEGGEP